MSTERDRELESPQSWDFERPEVRKPVKASRVVVSVAFRREDFIRVSGSADRTGKKTSEYIREAAIEKATGSGSQGFVLGIGGSGTLWSGEQMLTNTGLASRVEPTEEALVTTY